ncbi:MAG: RcnB family protein [Alphaproteobacteria bacterium]|nr:RcnB family protein [Alphaproteobacteria bacterium]
MPTHSIAKNKSGHCPPGLAKKNPPCVPPGLAKKRYRVGDRLPDGDYYYVRDPSRYGLPYLNYNESYYRIGDSYIRVDRDTREVLELIEALGAVLN